MTTEKQPQSAWDKIQSYCLKNKVDPRYFQFYDLWVFTKGGNINLLATKAKHEKFYAKREQRRQAKMGLPHICDTRPAATYTDAEIEAISGVSRQYFRYVERGKAKLDKRGNEACHNAVPQMNHLARHQMSHRTKNQNINFFVKTLTQDHTLSGPRSFRKNVVRLRLEQMRSQTPPPTVSVPANGIEGQLVA